MEREEVHAAESLKSLKDLHSQLDGRELLQGTEPEGLKRKAKAITLTEAEWTELRAKELTEAGEGRVTRDDKRCRPKKKVQDWFDKPLQEFSLETVVEAAKAEDLVMLCVYLNEKEEDITTKDFRFDLKTYLKDENLVSELKTIGKSADELQTYIKRRFRQTDQPNAKRQRTASAPHEHPTAAATAPHSTNEEGPEVMAVEGTGEPGSKAAPLEGSGGGNERTAEGSEKEEAEEGAEKDKIKDGVIEGAAAAAAPVDAQPIAEKQPPADYNGSPVVQAEPVSTAPPGLPKNVLDVLEKAWKGITLTPEEVLELLEGWGKASLPVQQGAPNKPKAGSIFFLLRKPRKDGYTWNTKETHATFKNSIVCYYKSPPEGGIVQRRCYWKKRKQQKTIAELSPSYADIVLVHYVHYTKGLTPPAIVNFRPSPLETGDLPTADPRSLQQLPPKPVAKSIEGQQGQLMAPGVLLEAPPAQPTTVSACGSNLSTTDIIALSNDLVQTGKEIERTLDPGGGALNTDDVNFMDEAKARAYVRILAQWWRDKALGSSEGQGKPLCPQKPPVAPEPVWLTSQRQIKRSWNDSPLARGPIVSGSAPSEQLPGAIPPPPAAAPPADFLTGSFPAEGASIPEEVIDKLKLASTDDKFAMSGALRALADFGFGGSTMRWLAIQAAGKKLTKEEVKYNFEAVRDYVVQGKLLEAIEWARDAKDSFNPIANNE